MSETLTLDDLPLPLRALRLLATDFGHLPVPHMWVSPIYPEHLKLAFHDDLAHFEAWREALGIAPDAVTHGTQSEGHVRVLKTSVEYAGATLELVGYADIPDPEPAGASVR